ncbi:acetoin utilization protein AcuC [soil metagenome]|jgi:acetoin utilization protein AcuC|nr:acetoin utilization protein AcuC [Deinococcota bacterium]
MKPHTSCAFLYDPRLTRYKLSDGHPFKPLRLELTRSLLHEAGLLAEADEVTPEAIPDKVLAQVHAPAYLGAVRAASRGERLPRALEFGLGTGDNPIFPGMHEAVSLVCAATRKAVDLVASETVQRAANLSGGLHHAHFDRASGFCVYNDLAVGIRHAVKGYGMRVAYIDIDAHHGDGVQWLFYDRSEVMTISLHESGRYLFPGSGHVYELGKDAGRGLSVNMPLEPFTEDDSFTDSFEAVVPEALAAFKPDLIVLQAGADMHRFDPLADLALSTRGMARAYRRVSELADHYCAGRLIATGGGGYDPYRTVPRAWSLLWATLSRQEVPERVPEGWRETWQEVSLEPLPQTFHDDPAEHPPIARRSEIASHNRATVKRVLTTLAPIWKER